MMSAEDLLRKLATLEKEAEQRKPWVSLTVDEIKKTYFGCRADFVDYAHGIEDLLREKNQ